MGDFGNKEVMSKNIQYYMDECGKSRQDVCNDLGIKYSTFTDWVNANTYPRIDKIEMLANYFGIEKSDLIEEKNKKEYYLNEETIKLAQEIFENPTMRSLFDMSRKIEPEQLEAHLDFMKSLYLKENGDGEEL